MIVYLFFKTGQTKYMGLIHLERDLILEYGEWNSKGWGPLGVPQRAL